VQKKKDLVKEGKPLRERVIDNSVWDEKTLCLRSTDRYMSKEENVLEGRVKRNFAYLPARAPKSIQKKPPSRGWIRRRGNQKHGLGESQHALERGRNRRRRGIKKKGAAEKTRRLPSNEKGKVGEGRVQGKDMTTGEMKTKKDKLAPER